MNELFRKLNYKNQSVIHVVNAPASLQPALAEMAGVAEVRASSSLAKAKNVTFALGFAITKAEVDALADQLAKASEGDVVAWIAYPKGTSKKNRCEFNRDNGWDRFGAHGFEPVRQVAIDEDWSALRFRRVENIKAMTRASALTQQGKARIKRSGTQ